MEQALAQLLNGKKFVAEAHYQWGESRLRVQSYLSAEIPPPHLISSARCIVLQGNEVLTITDAKGDLHIVPGGRCEAGETPLQTMVRELFEETGWSVQHPQVIGFIHFQHVTDKPPGYKYPYPDFIQLIYTGVAGHYLPEKMEDDGFVVASEFRPIAQIIGLIADNQKAFLQQALTLRQK